MEFEILDDPQGIDAVGADRRGGVGEAQADRTGGIEEADADRAGGLEEDGVDIGNQSTVQPDDYPPEKRRNQGPAPR